MNILDEIFAFKREEVAQLQRTLPLAELRRAAENASPGLDFVAALRRSPAEQAELRTPRLIAEVKCASPSRGLLAPDFDPLRLAQIYQQNGAAAISILTDERYFKGSLAFLRQITDLQTGLPLLRKDFIFDPYQLYEARAAGADAALLIAAGLEAPLLRDLHALAQELGLAPLVEVHNLEELGIVLECNPRLIGINNRDLHDFSISLETTLELRPYVPPNVCLVAESGIHTPADVAYLAAVGVDAILVGEALVTSPDVAAKVRSLAN